MACEGTVFVDLALDEVRPDVEMLVLWHLSEVLADELVQDELAACQFALALLGPRAEA